MTHLGTRVRHTDTGTNLVRHCGREQHGLSVVGTQADDLLHLLLKVLVQHPEGQKGTADHNTPEATKPPGESFKVSPGSLITGQPRPGSGSQCEPVRSSACCGGDRSGDQE